MIHVYVQGDDLSLFDLTPFINLDDRNLSVVCNAEQGSVGTSSFAIDDHLGQLDDQLNGLRFVFIDEDEAPAEHQRVFVGFTAARDVTRLDAPVGTSRKFNLQVEDINGLLSRRVMTGGDNDRPAENDVERVEWLMGTGESGHFDDTVTFIDTTGPVDMDAVNYEGQMFNQVLDDCAQTSGKNYYARWLWNDYLGDYESAIWYGPDDSSSALSNLRISNIRSDVDAEVGHDVTFPDSSTWYGSLDSKLNINPSRLFYGVFANYDGGVTYRSLSTTRDTITSWPNVKTLAKANARSDRYLATLGVEEEVVETSILVPPHNVNDAMAGDEIEVRFSHFPGWEEFRAVRILNRTVTFVTPEVYQIDYTVTPIDTTPPISCTTVLAAMQTYDSGSLGSTGGSNGPPLAVSPDSPAAYPGVVIGGIFGHQGATEMANHGTPTVTGFTELMALPVGSTSSVAGAGYKALTSGSPGNLTLNFFLGGGAAGAEKWRGVACYLPTSATSPVQSKVNTSGSTITLDSTPTPGNILVLVRAVETSPFATNGPGFSDVVSGDMDHIGPGVFTVDIVARCVVEGDTDIITVQDTSFSHWQVISEWALT